MLHNTVLDTAPMTIQAENPDTGDIIRSKREQLRLTQGDLASRVGTKQQTIEKIELGKIKHSSYLPAICSVLGIDFSMVARNVPGPASPPKPIPASDLYGERDLPVYAVVQGGSGALILSSEPVEWVARPEPLARKQGYGVIVVEDSMAPEYRSGDIALVNPHIPPRAGDTCVFRSTEADGTQIACIKFLRRSTETNWQVSEWNSSEGGQRDFNLPKAKWQSCHVAVGNYKRR